MTAADADRRLAAIMFTDMVGYSALSQRDEALAAPPHAGVAVGAAAATGVSDSTGAV